MLVSISMQRQHRGEMWLTFRRVDDSGPVKEARLLRRACERLTVTDHILLLISDAPFPGNTSQALTVTVKYKETMRFVSRFLPANHPAPLESLFVVTDWLAGQSPPRTTLHLLIVPAPSVQDDEDPQVERLKRFLLHYVIEQDRGTLFTLDLWTLWSRHHPGSAPKDREIGGIKRRRVYKVLREVFEDFPPTEYKPDRSTGGSERYYVGYKLRKDPMIPSCPVGCWCSA